MHRSLPAALLLLCSCATVPLASADLDERLKVTQPAADAAVVYVFRPPSLAGTAVALAVTFDEARVARLPAGHYAVLVVRPGEHKLVVTASGSAEQALVADAGRAYFFRAEPSLRLSGGPGVALEQVADEATARAEVARCNLVADPAVLVLREAAETLGKVNVAGVPAERLVTSATAALDLAAGGDAASADLERAVVRLRGARPGIPDLQVVQTGAAAMVAAIRAGVAAPPRAAATGPATGPAIVRSLGLVLRGGPVGAEVAGVLASSPAAAAGLAAGLELRKIGEFPTGAAPPALLAAALAAPPGTDVTLVVGAPGESGRAVTLRHRAVDPGATDCAMLGGEVLYLRPAAVTPAAARRVRDYARTAGGGRLPVLLDLRGAAGGSLDGVHELADSFLAAGTTLAVDRAPGAPVERRQASAGTSGLEAVPVVVLVDGGTMGMAEAVAAALQGAGRARLRGAPTAGDGVLSGLWRMGGESFQVPVGHLARPGGGRIDRGLVPDLADDGLAPGPDVAPAMAACPGDAPPGQLPADPMAARAALALRSTGGAAYQGAGR